MSRQNQKIEKELRRLLSVLMAGSREEFKKAKKGIETLWHRETEAFKAGAHVALEFLQKFDRIGPVVNKAALVSGLSLFFLVLADDHFEILKNFTLKVIRHPNGHVREAMRKTAEWLYVSLTARMDPFMYPKGKKLTDKQRDEQIKAHKQYEHYVRDIKALIDQYDTGDENTEYVDEMKPSVNKSLQQLWGRLTESRSYQKLPEAAKPVPSETLLKRKQIEEELVKQLRVTESIFSLQDVKDAIFHEKNSNDLMKVVAMLDRGGDTSELDTILELATNAWNYFPHKILNGLSPAEKLSDY
ncbi:hypothetical protein KJ657_04790 [Patescibacteria group bacterium]|nr:hypothetical protein [Patescibacteria group bacterium]MBU1016371.1 hypothetical protein [Patescibacteria group bacterium]MBU1685447.1 hypothetical protein [Patescibacteria group bacterium]